MEEDKLLKRKRRAIAEKNNELLASTLEKLGELYQSQGHYDEALEVFKEERDLCIIMGKSMQAAVVDRWMGEIYCNMGEYKEALKKHKQYFEVANAEKNLIEEQRALATIGRTYYCMAESVSASSEAEYKRALREAKQAYMLSLKVCDKINNINRYELMQMRSRLLQNMGLVFEAQGDFEKAVEHIEKAISINKKANLLGDTFSCYISMASLYQKQGNSVLSLKYHDLALEVGEQLSDKTQVSEALCSKADVYFSVANYRAAKQTLIKAYKICKHSSEEKSVIEKNLKIAHVLCESEEKLTKMSDSDHNAMKELYEQMGDVCCAVKNFKQAATYYLKMFECCVALGLSGEALLPALFSLSQTYEDATMYEESLKYLQKELDILDSDPMEACKKCMNIVQVLELKGASYQDIMKNLENAYEYALIANNETLEIKVLKMKLKIQEKHGHVEDASKTRSELEVIITDRSSLANSSDSSDDDDVVTPDVINDLSLTDILDEPDANTGETSRSRQVRRQPQGGIKIRRNEKGETQLQVACIAGNYQRVKQLIDLKHPVNVTDNGGWTPLHEVCNHGFVDLVELLLDHGANINDPGGIACEGVTPLHDACLNGHLQIVQILLDRGACIDVRTYNNKTPLDFLMEWSSKKGELTQENVGLFESIRDRLKTGLEKAGLSTESVNVSLVQDARKLERIQRKGKQIRKSPAESKTFERKRSWSLVSPVNSCNESSDEETSRKHSDCNTDDKIKDSDDSDSESMIFNPPLIEENPTIEYQRVMKGLRKKVVKVSSKKYDKMKKNRPLIQDADVVDDWLIDDMKDHTRTSKKRKIYNCDKGGAKLIGTLRKDVTISGDDSWGSYESISEECPHMDAEEKPSKVEEDIQDTNQIIKHNHNDKKGVHRHQSSLFDSGFACTSSDKNATRNDTVISVSENKATIPTVKVHIEKISLIVPIFNSETSTSLTIDWLAKEAARRYLKLQGKEPILMLLTKDGATLAADDPVSVIFDSKEVQALVTEWKEVSILQRYTDVCSASDLECLPLIQNSLRECDITHCLNLSNGSLYLDSLKPLFKSLQHGYCLKELVLGGNALMDEGLEVLCKVEGLPLLEVLDLSCNGISSMGLTSLCYFFNHCQSLKVLDLSYNDFEEDWLQSLHNIFEVLKGVVSLSLKSCDMPGDEFTFWEGENPPLNNMHSVEVLDISYNPLGEHGISGFLRYLNTSRVREINVACTAVEDSNSMPKILEFFQRGCPSNLRVLDLSDCNVTDDELVDLLRCLEAAKNLSTLLLSSNSSLTELSLNALMKMPKVPDVLDLVGCDQLFPSCDEQNDDVCLNDAFLKKMSSLTISCNMSKGNEAFNKCCETIKDKWKHTWGDRANVLIGPCGLIKLDLLKIEEE